MAGHGSSPPPDKAWHPSRNVAPSSWGREYPRWFEDDVSDGPDDPEAANEAMNEALADRYSDAEVRLPWSKRPY